MKVETFREFVDYFYEAYLPKRKREYPFHRVGQELMIYVARYWNALYVEMLANYDIDCFYDDKVIPSTLEYLQSQWGKIPLSDWTSNVKSNF